AAGLEMDSALAALCQSNTGHSHATFGLAMAVLPNAHWSAIAPLDPLRRWRLIEVDETTGLTSGRLRLEERVLHYLAGLNYLDHRLQAMLTPVPATQLMAGEHIERATLLRQQLQTNNGQIPVVQLTGDDRHAQQDVARTISDALNVRLFSLPAESIPTGVHECASLATLWQREAALLSGALLITDTLAGRYRLGARRIGDIAALVRTLPNDHIASALHTQCRGDDAPLLALAQRIEPRAGWDDLVLPDIQRRILAQIVVHTRQRIRVHHDWGFADKGERGLGLASLFAGESGTGKTLAAEVLAHELGLALYRIDLSAVISKYIGETEKNLRKVFDAAEDIGAILLFDEADALFGKRSEVKDSHDRYANIEVSYLLQRMEAYRGLAILTTNHKTALDTAFSRRLRFVVNFPFPDAAQREAIWRGVFPPKTPVNGLDFAKLARLNVAGGNIRNIALAAAFMAAEAGTGVSMALLRQAAHTEATKRDKPFSDAEVRGWA
ncbi:MAG: ATP-binding protein, partial [Candidatus Thiodiazotropha sp.]